MRRALIMLLLFVVPAIAAAERLRFDDLHQKYLSLRNTDLDFKRMSEWIELQRDFIEYARREPNPFQAQRALLECAILYQTMAAKIEPDKNRLRALGLLEELVGRFPRGVLADDALLTEAKILRDEGAHEEADYLLRQIVGQYPESDMALVAQKKLGGIDKKKSVGFESMSNAHLPLLVLDPGHGGEDFGAVGVGGLLEKDVALDLALKAKRLIEAGGKYRVQLTRSKDQFIPLVDRMKFANQRSAALFLSIHANASVHKNLSGFETYYLDNKADKASLKLAERENKSGEGQSSGDLSFMLSDLIQNAKLPESITLAKTIQRALAESVRALAPQTPNLGVKSGPFYVLVGAHMPCVLVEVAFIDNAEEGARLGEQEFREQLARGIARGVEQFKQ